MFFIISYIIFTADCSMCSTVANFLLGKSLTRSKKIFICKEYCQDDGIVSEK
jgi:hypothetical protein